MAPSDGGNVGMSGGVLFGDGVATGVAGGAGVALPGCGRLRVRGQRDGERNRNEGERRPGHCNCTGTRTVVFTPLCPVAITCR